MDSHFSPLSKSTVQDPAGKSILLQLFLKVLLEKEVKSKGHFCPVFPYAWGTPIPSIAKVEDLLCLFPHAFPDQDEHNLTLKKNTHLPFNELFSHLTPFLTLCKDSAPLLVFLLRHQEGLDHLVGKGTTHTLLKEMQPKGGVTTLIRDHYTLRSYTSYLQQIEPILKDYERSHP